MGGRSYFELPASFSLPPTLTPSRCELLSRPFVLEPPPFLCAIGFTVLLSFCVTARSVYFSLKLRLSCSHREEKQRDPQKIPTQA